MAGDWIKVEKELNDKPEVRRMARALHLSRFDIVGRLVSVWSWADTHSFTGSGMDISEEDIDDIAILEHLRVLPPGDRLSSFMAYRMRRWEGLRPSLTSGRAREMMTDME